MCTGHRPVGAAAPAPAAAHCSLLSKSFLYFCLSLFCICVRVHILLVFGVGDDGRLISLPTTPKPQVRTLHQVYRHCHCHSPGPRSLFCLREHGALRSTPPLHLMLEPHAAPGAGAGIYSTAHMAAWSFYFLPAGAIWARAWVLGSPPPFLGFRSRSLGSVCTACLERHAGVLATAPHRGDSPTPSHTAPESYFVSGFPQSLGFIRPPNFHTKFQIHPKFSYLKSEMVSIRFQFLLVEKKNSEGYLIN